MSDNESEDYDFEYSDENDINNENDKENIIEIELENQYYTAKSQSENNIKKSIELFLKVLEIQEINNQKTEWGFKALKRLVKLEFNQFIYDNYENKNNNKNPNVLIRYSELLEYAKTGAVTKNVIEKGIHSVLDYISKSKEWKVLGRFYDLTLEFLKEYFNERLWFRTNLKLGQVLFELQDYKRLGKIIKELLNSCQDKEGDGRNATQLLEVYALQIQMYTEQKDNNKLLSIYEKSLKIKSGIPHPRIVGIIRECGGKMHMMQHQWTLACTDFFEGFKSYEEAGEPRKIQCLKYLVLANMLSESKINVFDSQEAKVYENDKNIITIKILTDAFLHDDIKTFENVLKENRESIMSDSFIWHYIDNLIRTIRSKVLAKLVKPYKEISLCYIAQELNGITVEEVESLLVLLINDEKVEGKIDQVKNTLILDTKYDISKKNENMKYYAFNEWSTQLNNLHLRVLSSNSIGITI